MSLPPPPPGSTSALPLPLQPSLFSPHYLCTSPHSVVLTSLSSRALPLFPRRSLTITPWLPFPPVLSLLVPTPEQGTRVQVLAMLNALQGRCVRCLGVDDFGSGVQLCCCEVLRHTSTSVDEQKQCVALLHAGTTSTCVCGATSHVAHRASHPLTPTRVCPESSVSQPAGGCVQSTAQAARPNWCACSTHVHRVLWCNCQCTVRHPTAKFNRQRRYGVNSTSEHKPWRSPSNMLTLASCGRCKAAAA